MATCEAKSIFGVDSTTINRKKYIDVVLLSGIDYKIISGHRVVFAACSSLLDELLTAYEQSQSGELCLIIDDVHGAPLQALVDSFYTGELKINLDNLDGILATAKVLRLQNAIAACEDFIHRNINISTGFQLYALAERHSLPSLQLSLKKFICANFMEVCKKHNFLQINNNLLAEIISSDWLEVDSENDVLAAILRWLTHDDRRGQHIPDLINHMRVVDIEPSFVVENLQITGRFPQMQKLFNEVFSYQHSPASLSSIGTHRLQPRMLIRSNMIVIALYGLHKSIFKYCPHTNQWSELMCFNEKQRNFGACKVNNKELVVGGGQTGSEIIAAVVSINLSTKTITHLKALNTGRTSCQLVFLDNTIYAIGGCNDKESLNTVERLDRSNGAWTTWRYVTNMKEKRCGAAAAVLNGFIYAVGGYSGKVEINDGYISIYVANICLNSVEYYDPNKNEWQMCAPMNVKRVWPEVAVLNNYIYVVGGYDVKRLASVERYDPLNNAWTQICSLNTARSSFACVALNGRLIAAGGWDGSKELDCVEEYNPDLNVWIAKAALPKAGRLAKCI